MTEIKAILFDKDGTLLKMENIWLEAAQETIRSITSEFPNPAMRNRLEESIGIVNQQILANGILAMKTSRDIAKAFYEVLGKEEKVAVSESFDQFEKKVIDLLFKGVEVRSHLLRPTADLHRLFKVLTAAGYVLGIATADDKKPTMLSLKSLGIQHFIRFVGTAECFQKSKPDPMVLHSFCDKFNLDPAEVAIVGDTIVDLLLARNGKAGASVGVLSGAGKREDLEPFADYIVNSVADIVKEDGTVIWDQKRLSC